MSKWFYVLDGKQVGPLEEKEIVQKINNNSIDKTTLVWKVSVKVLLLLRTLSQSGKSG